ncbi:MAG TPA: type 4a pilus biogenesis protein PilO [Tepidisphaeraceae bacterium]|nr:type 4a pilus biogenesis protein PilO [Tepidisphaeraceae bacterium]
MRSLQTQAEWCNRAQWVLGIALGTMVVGFYLFVFRPNSERLEGLNGQIATKSRDLAGNQTRVQILPDVLRQVGAMQDRLAKFDKKLPKQPELGPFINDITELSHQSGLRTNWTVEPGVPQRGDLYAEWPIALRFEGEFTNVFDFLRRAEEMQRLTRMKGMRVRSAGTGNGKNGQVQVELSMNIYFSEG